MHAVLEELFDLPAAERTPEAAVGLLPGRWQALVDDRPELARMILDDAALTEESWFAEAAKLVERWFTLEDPSRLEPSRREVEVEVEVDGLTLRPLAARDEAQRAKTAMNQSETSSRKRKTRRTQSARCPSAKSPPASSGLFA